jgi:hypothetical protein
MACLQEGLFPPEPPRSSAGTAAHPNEVGFSNGLLIARKHCGRQPEWRIKPDRLQAKTGSEDARKGFMFKLRKLAQADTLPGYAMTLEDDAAVVVFRPRTVANAVT